MKKKILKISFIAVSVFLAFSIVAFALVWNGIIILNDRLSYQYEIKGVDVSSYQGEIDWSVLSSQKISFAFKPSLACSNAIETEFA